jgi:cytochrome c biogenesis factor
MVSWLWIGGLVLTIGALLAIAPEQRRVRRPQPREITA